MRLEQIIHDFVQLGYRLAQCPAEEKAQLFARARAENAWFTPANLELAWAGVLRYLHEANLRQWLAQYPAVPTASPKRVGVIMAGNIPLVGFHDFLSVLVSGHTLHAKLSSQDAVLLPYIIRHLQDLNPAWVERVVQAEQLKDLDAYIATGSDNSARYFEYYFAQKPHIIRRNRVSVAMLDGTESPDDLRALGDDIFQYFGLGCRNVAKLYVPEEYDFRPFFEAMEAWAEVAHHNKYANNYDYHRAIFLMNQTPHLDNGFVTLLESVQIASPTGVLFVEYYHDAQDLHQKINAHLDKIQVCVARRGSDLFPTALAFGTAQQPQLWDYADRVDTLSFLATL